MSVRKNGEIVRIQLIDKLFVDYLWYRTCQINEYSVCIMPTAEDLERQLSSACRHQNAQTFMRTYDIRDNSPLDLDRFIKTLHKEYSKICLSKDDINWIEEKNTRLLCYIWRCLNHLTFQAKTEMFNDDLQFQFTPITSTNNAKILTQMDNIINLNVSKFVVICCLNRLGIDKLTKLNLLKNIRQVATHAINNQEITNWLNKDEKLKISWTHDYLRNINSGYIPLVPPGSSGVKDDIISFFDVTCSFNEDKSKLITITMKKAWSQRKYRENNKGKKQYSINMSTDIGGILDELSIEKNENKNTIVELLIRNEYSKIKK